VYLTTVPPIISRLYLEQGRATLSISICHLCDRGECSSVMILISGKGCWMK